MGIFIRIIFLMLHLTTLKLFILIVTGFTAGVVDSVAGGGGLVVLPVLLGLGVPPVTALGTTRFQALIGESVAIRRFVKHGGLKLSALVQPLIYAGIGSALGTVLVQCIQVELLKKIIPILLISFIAYSALSGKLFNKPIIKLPEQRFAILFGLGIGFYNGFFGPGTGSLWFAAFLAFQGISIKNAAMSAKVPNVIGNLVSVLVFSSQLHIAIIAGVLLALGQVIGANLGARLVIHQGAKIVRPIFMIVVTVMAIELITKAF